jgi:hypothetical protein
VRANPPRQLAGAPADPPEEGGLRAAGVRINPVIPGPSPPWAKVEKGGWGTHVSQGARAVRAGLPLQLAGARADPPGEGGITDRD